MFKAKVLSSLYVITKTLERVEEQTCPKYRVENCKKISDELCRK